MTRRWPPPEAGDPGTDDPRVLKRRAEERAALIARYWDDTESEAENVEIIGWWLSQNEGTGDRGF